MFYAHEHHDLLRAYSNTLTHNLSEESKQCTTGSVRNDVPPKHILLAVADKRQLCLVSNGGFMLSTSVVQTPEPLLARAAPAYAIGSSQRGPSPAHQQSLVDGGPT